LLPASPNHLQQDFDKVLIRYGEIGLKSPSIRSHLEALLMQHIKQKMGRLKIPIDKIVRERGRIFILTSKPLKVASAAAKVFGVVSTSPVHSVKPTLKSIILGAEKVFLPLLLAGQSFAVRTRRTKNQPITSMEAAREVGSHLLSIADSKNIPVRVDLDNPDLEIFIEIREKEASIFTQIIKGPGGLPYGSQGTVIGLHSGGIDSPVAQWLLMKRGCRVIPVFFDSSNDRNSSIYKRAISTAKALSEWIPEAKPQLIVIPYRKLLEVFTQSKNPKQTCLLCKRMMYRLATKIASKENGIGLVTGETLGQVASQTLTNLSVLNQATHLPVFRPLIGLDKVETMAFARQIGTYTESAQTVEDCFAVPEHPEISGDLSQIQEAEKMLKLEPLITEAIAHLKRIPLR
jgi:thiamine biosynthesis protein ThiI